MYQAGHFGRAAEECGVTQPTLSMQIQKLENDLGVVIFDRSKKPILLTKIGEKMITQVQSVLFEARKIEGVIESNQKGGVSGELVIGVIPTIAPYLLPRLLPRLQKKYSDLRLMIRELQTHQIIEKLQNDSIDVGLLALPLKLNKLIECPLYYEPFHLLCKKNHLLSQSKKIKMGQLDLKELWLLEEGHCLRHQVLDVCALKKNQNDQKQFQFESGSLETLKNLVSSYGGYTLLPSLAAENIGEETVLLSFERPIPSRQIGLIYQRTHYKTDLIESIGEVILESIPEEIKKIREKDLNVIDVK